MFMFNLLSEDKFVVMIIDERLGLAKLVSTTFILLANASRSRSSSFVASSAHSYKYKQKDTLTLKIFSHLNLITNTGQCVPNLCHCISENDLKNN